MSDQEKRRIKNRADKDRRKRRKLKEKLRARGVPKEKIERIIEQRRQDDRAKRHGYNIDSLEYDPDNDQGFYPDDSGYEPNYGDPLLRGAGRADGMTAKVVKRRETITDWQYDRVVADREAE